MHALISLPFADLFDRPDSNCPRSDELLYGTLVEILTVLPGSWYKIRTFYRYDGYTLGKNLIFLSHWQKICQQNPNQAYGSLKIVAKRCCDILKEPNVKSPLICCLAKGSYIYCCPEYLNSSCHSHTSEAVHPSETVHTSNDIDSPEASCSSDDDGYSKVFLYNGLTGYCKSSCLASCPVSSGKLPTDETAFRNQVTKTALFYLNTQYRWGGKSPLGIDCSGLTFMSYLLNGVIIYRDASMKPGFPVHPIHPDKKRPGDLLYFPGHIAMYLGNEQYIHSTARSKSDGVVINSLNPLSSNYRKDLHQTLTAVGSIF